MLELTATTLEASEASLKTPQIILDIDGISTAYSLVDSLRQVRYGDNYDYGDAELYYGKPALDSTVLPYISLSGTTTNITQQIDPIAASSSIQNISINIVDKDGSVSESFYNTDIFTSKANVYLSFKNLEHPKDSVRIFSGLINGIEYSVGSVKLKIDNPEYLKTQELFTEYKDTTTLALTDSDTTITVENTTDIIESADALTTYIRIEDEIILVGTVTATELTGCTRGQLGTIAVAHDIETDVSSIYRLQGNGVELALKTMLSSADDYEQAQEITNFVQENGTTIPNAVYFDVTNIENYLGLVVGDLIRISGSTSNDGDYTAVSFGTTENNTSYVELNTNITTETALGSATFKSKYNTLPIGAGCSMLPNEVDVKQYETVLDNYLLNSPDFDFKITESKTADDFINTEILKVLGAYPLPRKGVSSIGYTSPPVASGETVFLNEDNIVDAFSIKLNRTVKDNFFNNVVYKYAHDIIEDKFLSINQVVSGDSVSRYRAGNQPFTVESYGLLNNPATENFINSVSSRMLDRYRYGAEFLEVKVLYSTGFRIEAGDTVVLDGTKISLYDSKTGLKDTFTRVMEVVNKKLDVKNGKISLSLVDTAFGVVGRYSSISPASTIIDGSTATEIRLSANQLGQAQGYKWASFIGASLLIRDKSFTTVYNVTLTGYNASKPDFIQVSGAYSAPTSGHIVEFTPYEYQNAQQKTIHGNITHSLFIEAATSSSEFSLFSADVNKVFEGGYVVIRNTDFSNESNIVKIKSLVAGRFITLEEDLPFMPSAGDRVEFCGYSSDKSDAYIIL